MCIDRLCVGIHRPLLLIIPRMQLSNSLLYETDLKECTLHACFFAVFHPASKRYE
jgi:hypothetical protein